MPSPSEADDLATVKRSRSTAKGQITAAANRLEKILVSKDDKFDHQAINEIEVKDYHDRLQANFTLFKEAHSKVQSLREVEATEKEEEKVILDEEKYFGDIADRVYPLFRKHIEYTNSLSAKQILSESLLEEEKSKNEMISGIAGLEIELREEQDKYASIKELVIEIKNSLEKVSSDKLLESLSIISQPASSLKLKLQEAFDKTKGKAKELTSALQARGDKQDSVDKVVSFDNSKETKQFVQLDSALDRVINIQKLSNSGRRDSVDTPFNSTLNDKDTKSTPIKLEKPAPIKFSGNARDFAAFKEKFEAIVVPNRSAADIGLYLHQAIPGKYQHLVKNFKPMEHVKMMEVLVEKFGTTRVLVEAVNAEIERLKLPTTDKMFVELVEKLEKIKIDMEAVDKLDEISNAHTIAKIEAKLPSTVKQDWVKEVISKKYEKGSTKDKFNKFFEFLAGYKLMAEYETSEIPGVKAYTHLFTVPKSPVSSGPIMQTPVSCSPGSGGCGQGDKGGGNKGGKAKKSRPCDQSFPLKPCIACNDGATDEDCLLHDVESCEVWKSLSLKDKEAKVKCKKHPFADHKTSDCRREIRPCKYCQEKTHHFLLCYKKKATTNATKNAVIRGASAGLPVMVQTNYVKAGDGKTMLGTMWDLCSTDNYIQHKFARKLGLEGDEVELTVGVIRNIEHTEMTKLYKVPILDLKGNTHIIDCYGFDVITGPAVPPKKASYERLCHKFGIKVNEVRKPSEINLMISMRDNPLHPRAIKCINNMTLYDGIFGKVFGGCDENLDFIPPVRSSPTRVVEVDRRCVQTMKSIVKAATQVSSAKYSPKE